MSRLFSAFYRTSMAERRDGPTVLTEGELKELVELKTFTSSIETLCSECRKVEEALAVCAISSNTAIQTIASNFRGLIQQNFPAAVQSSLLVASSGSLIATDMLALCALDLQSKTPEEIKKFVDKTKEMASQAHGDAQTMVDTFRSMRVKMLSMIITVKAQRQETGVFTRLTQLFNGVKKSLKVIISQLQKQEQLATLFVNWWKRIEMRLSDIVVLPPAAGVHNNYSLIWHQTLTERWKTLKDNYDGYTTSIMLIQDTYPGILLNPASDQSNHPAPDQSIHPVPRN